MKGRNQSYETKNYLRMLGRISHRCTERCTKHHKVCSNSATTELRQRQLHHRPRRSREGILVRHGIRTPRRLSLRWGMHGRRWLLRCSISHNGRWLLQSFCTGMAHGAAPSPSSVQRTKGTTLPQGRPRGGGHELEPPRTSIASGMLRGPPR